MITRPDQTDFLEAEAQRTLRLFQDFGARKVDVPTLLDAEILLDLYGENIRERAFIVHDVVGDAYVLRPDFTVPIVAHVLDSGVSEGPQSFCYFGRVWRRHLDDTHQRHDFWQLGIEDFRYAEDDVRDIEILKLAQNLARPFELHLMLGDIGLLLSTLEILPMDPWRRDALRRHIWRKHAFDRLLVDFSNPNRRAWGMARLGQIEAPLIGRRDEALIQKRQDRIRLEMETAPIAPEHVRILKRIFALKGSLSEVERALFAIAQDDAAFEALAEPFEARNKLFADAGFDPDLCAFDAHYGRFGGLEFYDGLVFGYHRGEDSPSVISGGRYDHLTKALSDSHGRRAFGFAYRPERIWGAR